MATKKRLIDATPIIDECKECSVIEWNKSVYTTWAEAEEDFMQRLLDAPTVDAVEVVHGRWKNVKETEVYSPDHRCTFTHTAQTCSVCNVRIGFIGSKFYLYDGYCPNCGAKMDGDGNET